MKLYWVSVLFLVWASFSSGQPNVSVANKEAVPEKTGSAVAQEEATAALRFHNEIRNDVNVPPLVWSAELAKYAQEWADYLANKNGCQIAHRSTIGKADKNYGENIFWGSGKAYSSLDASKAWYSEIEDYKYQPIARDTYFPTGHYTQMVWNSTKKVGIGVAKCSDGATIIVANYDPPGNILGKKPY